MIPAFMSALALPTGHPCRVSSPRHSQSLPRSSFTTVPLTRRDCAVTRPATWAMTAASPPTPSPASRPGQAAGGTASTKLERVVCKFGGSSLADAERLLEVTKLLRLQMDLSEKKPIVVLSAMGPSTNELLDAGDRALNQGIVDTSTVRGRAYAACDDLGLNKHDLVDPLLHNLDELLVGVKFIKELSPRTKDYLVSFGERLSVRIFATHLKQNEGINAKYVDAFDAGFLTNSDFTRAELDERTFDNVRRYVAKEVDDSDSVAIVTGFIAKDADGCITTLGRGGSDLTACVIGAALDVTEVQVWKDVDGILSTDPRIVKEAVPVPFVSFEEAAEMAFFGAKILHPNAMQPAMRFNIPVRVKNSYNPSHPGTVIVQTRAFDQGNPVTAISLKKSVQVVDIVSTRMLGASGFLSEVFKAFAVRKISIDMIATSEVSISLTLDNALCDMATLQSLKDELASIASVSFSQNDKAIVSLVSDSARSSGVVGRAVSALDRGGIRVLMISQGASKYNVSVIVDMDNAPKAVEAMHKEFFNE